MRCSVRCRGVVLLSVLLVHTALGSPVVRRDVRLLLGDDKSSALADPKMSLVNADVFGGEAHENGARDKRTLKLGALALSGAAKAVGAGVGAVHGAAKSVALAGLGAVHGAVKSVAVAGGKTALKVATTVGVKVAKAAITIGIAKLLLNLVFGKINQLIDFKTRLLGNVGNGKGLLASSNLGSLSSSSGSSSGGLSSSSGGLSSSSGSSSNSGGTGAADAGYDGGETTEGAAGDSEIGDDLPVIDPQKVSLQIPSEIVGGGFEVVNKGAPVIGELIQRTAERLVNIGASLKPLLGFSLGFGGANNGNYKRETGEFGDSNNKPEQENEESNDFAVTAEAPSQFKRMVDPSEKPAEDSSEGAETSDEEPTREEEEDDDEEEKKKLVNTLLAKKVIEKLIEDQIEEELKRENDELNQAAESRPQIVQIKRDAVPSAPTNQQSRQASLPTPTYDSAAVNQATYQTTNILPPYQNKNLPTHQATSNQQAYQTPENPYFHQQYRSYNPHVKRQAPLHEYQNQYQNLQQYPQWYPQYRNQYYPQANYQYSY